MRDRGLERRLITDTKPVRTGTLPRVQRAEPRLPLKSGRPAAVTVEIRRERLRQKRCSGPWLRIQVVWMSQGVSKWPSVSAP